VLHDALAELPPGCAPACGACERPRSVEESLAGKKARAIRALSRWEDRIEDIVSPPEERRLGYRDRTALKALWTPEEGWRFGMEGVRTDVRGPLRFARPRPFVPLTDCPVHTERIRKMLHLPASALPPDEPEGSFPLSFLVVSGAQATFVFKAKTEPPSDGWLFEPRDGSPSLADALGDIGIEGLWFHANPAAGVRLFAKRGWRLAWGAPRSADSRGLLYGPASFSQLLPELHDASLDEARRFLVPGAGDAAADLYCGIGASLRLWRKCGADALGVEGSGEAVECALHNAPGAAVLRGSCADRAPMISEFLRSVPPERRIAYVNPPRTGLEPQVAELLASHQLRGAAYLSCSPGTLARDLAILEKEYIVERLVPYDFFPRTAAVEVLALLRGR